MDSQLLILVLISGLFELNRQILEVVQENLRVNTATMEATLCRNKLLEELMETVKK